MNLIYTIFIFIEDKGFPSGQILTYLFTYTFLLSLYYYIIYRLTSGQSKYVYAIRKNNS